MSISLRGRDYRPDSVFRLGGGLIPQRQTAGWWAILPGLLALMLLLMPFTAFSAGCGEEKKTGPVAAVEDLVHLLNARDFGPAYDSLAETSPYRNMTKNEFIQESERYFPSNATAFRLSDLTTSEIVIDGETATVSWSGTWAYGMKGETGDTITVDSTVVNEDGVWKVEDLWGN